MRLQSVRIVVLVLATALFATSGSVLPTPTASAEVSASFEQVTTEPFGNFGGVEFQRHTGLFQGETSLGQFRVPFEIVAATDPGSNNGTVLVEPPHFFFGPAGHDLVLGRELLFGAGYSYASVGYGTDGLMILDPTASGLILAGSPVASPGVPDPTPIVDEEIVIQFVHTLTSDPYSAGVLGDVEQTYAYGISQTSELLLEIFHSPGGEGEGLFDLSLLHAALWHPPFAPPTVSQNLPDEFQPLSGIGRVLFVESEGDLLLSEASQFRRATSHPDYRVYEVAGAAHFPTPDTNPLDHLAVARAIFTAGDDWIRRGATPPPSTLISTAQGIDPIYGFETGIERDADGNARGGVRLPDLHLGRAQFIAADFNFAPLGIPGLLGATVDLACEPEPGSTSDEPRFGSHGDYVNQFVQQVNDLRKSGFLLEDDAEDLKERAAQSEVGAPRTCTD